MAWAFATTGQSRKTIGAFKGPVKGNKGLLKRIFLDFFPDISWTFPGKNSEISRKFPGDLPGIFPDIYLKIRGILPENFRHFPGHFREHSGKFLGKFPGIFLDFSRKPPAHFPDICRKCLGNVPDISRMFSGKCLGKFVDFCWKFATFPGNVPDI